MEYYASRAFFKRIFQDLQLLSGVSHFPYDRYHRFSPLLRSPCCHGADADNRMHDGVTYGSAHKYRELLVAQVDPTEERSLLIIYEKDGIMKTINFNKL